MRRMVLIAACCVGCGAEAAAPPPLDAGAPVPRTDVDVAHEMLAAEGALPVRPVVVALSDRLAIAASRETGNRRADLALLAARLRERSWRFDRRETDAREALEQYSNAVAWAHAGPASCDADTRRALLAGELAGDALATFRQLFVAHTRQTHAGAGPGDPGCQARLSRLMKHLEAFRPIGQAWLDLELEARKGATEHVAAASSATATSSGAVPPAPAPAAPKGRNVVITPDPKLLGDKPAALVKVEPYSWQAGGRVVLSLDRPAGYKVGVLPPNGDAGRGHRLYVDLIQTRRKGVKRAIESKGMIEGVRLGKRGQDTRVVIDMGNAAYHRVFYLPNPFRVMIDLGTRAPPPAAAAGGDDSRRQVRRVTLDPGHGGWDDGAVGPTGLREKDVVLDVAHRAAPALASELGVETMLTRDTDAFVPLEERTARANAFHSDLFISIHCNATENGKARGVEIFILEPGREVDAAAMRAVVRENMSIHRHKGSLPPRTPAALDAQVASIAVGLDASATAGRSRLLAELLRKSTLSSVQQRYGAFKDHGVKTAGFFVLLGAEMPAVLYETAFISNGDDEQQLNTADFRQKLADAIVNAVRAYRAGKR